MEENKKEEKNSEENIDLNIENNKNSDTSINKDNNGENKEIKDSNEKKNIHDASYWMNAYYKLYADIENLRKELQEDYYENMKYHFEDFSKKILNILDSFYFALNSQNKSDEVKKFLFGFECVYRELLKILKEEGLEEISPKINDIFDAKNMSAIETIYCDNTEPNKVLKVNLKGYKLFDHLIRPAIVVVSTNEKKNISEDKKEKN